MTTSGGSSQRVGVFHPGTQHSWQTSLAFQEEGSLGWYATSIFYDPSRWPYRVERYLPGFLSRRLGAEFKRRYTPLLDLKNVRQFGIHEWLETFARRLGANSLASRINEIGNRAFANHIIDLFQREPVDVVWGYNSSSVEVFRWAKPQGIRCVLDQTIGHPAEMNRVMAEEHARNPDFVPDFYQPHSPEWIAQQDEEMDLADEVVCGSEFCAETMRKHGCDGAKIRVVPYGYDESLFPTIRPVRERMAGRPVQFLFIGSVESRKGAANLLSAFASIPRDVAQLVLVGRNTVPEKTFTRYANHITHIENVPRPEVVPHFLHADCFIFPSLFEGSALVLYEAVGAGLGIIQTTSSGNGASHGVNGLVFESLSQESIIENVLDLAANPDRLIEWQAASWDMRMSMEWGNYRKKIREMIDQ